MADKQIDYVTTNILLKGAEARKTGILSELFAKVKKIINFF